MVGLDQLKIRSLVLNEEEFKDFQAKLKDRPCLLIWKANKE